MHIFTEFAHADAQYASLEWFLSTPRLGAVLMLSAGCVSGDQHS